jgi:hypothetical protein
MRMRGEWKKLYSVQFDESCSLSLMNVMQAATHDHTAMQISQKKHCAMGVNPPAFI